MASVNTTTPPIVVFHRSKTSPWSRKFIAYMALRGIPYTSCEQPMVMPRPDLTALDINYRRVPVVAIGKDVYCDTALAMHKLDQLIPPAPATTGTQWPCSSLVPPTPEGAALQTMFQKFVEATLFIAVIRTIPGDFAPLFANAAVLKDRSEFIGADFGPESQERLRPEGIATVRATMEFLEQGLLADGRAWLLGDSGPTYADVHLAWVFAFSGVYQGDLAREGGKYPKVWAWVGRYEKLVEHGQQRMEIQDVDGDEAKQIVLGSGYAEGDVGVDENDSTGLKKGELVESWPLDFGFTHKDKGVLVGLTGSETVVQTQVGTRIHHPRYPFAVRKAE